MDEKTVRRIVREELGKGDKPLKFAPGDKVVVNFFGDVDDTPRFGTILGYAGEDNRYDYHVDLVPDEQHWGRKVYVYESEVELDSSASVAPQDTFSVRDLTGGATALALQCYAANLKAKGFHVAADVMLKLAKAREGDT